jgi:hypothetical protein
MEGLLQNGGRDLDLSQESDEYISYNLLSITLQ